MLYRRVTAATVTTATVTTASARRPRRKRRFTPAALLATAGLLAGFVVPGAAIAQEDDPTDVPAPVVVNEIATRGPNGALDEFVELRNVSDAPVDVSGWRIQRCNNTGTGFIGDQVTIAAGTVLPAGGHFLAVNPNGYPAERPRDAEFSVGIADNGGARIVDTSDAVIDGVGFGTNNNNCTIGAPAVGLTTAQGNAGLAVTRDADSTNTGDNATDFSTQPATPTSSAGVVDPDPDPDPDPDLCAVSPDDLTPINEIQGAGATTPILGQTVVTRGVVTADFTSGGASGVPQAQGLRGFFIEAIIADRDDDPQTSEGLFVFDAGGTFDGDLGDLVHVTGTAGEFSTVTQVSATDLEICTDTGVDTTLPPPAELPLPLAPAERSVVFEPLESMRVVHPELTVVEFFQLERFGEVRLSADGVLQNPTNVVDPADDAAYLSIVAANAAANIVLDDGRTGQNLDPLPYVEPGGTLRIGDQLGDAVTVLHFGFGQWRLQPVSIDDITTSFAENRTRPRPETPPDVGGSLTVASFNVLNYFDGDGQGGGFPNARGAVTLSELERQTEKIVDAIIGFDADVVGLIEIENDGGEFQATRTLVDAINAELGDDVYDFVDTGVIGTDAIKLAFIYQAGTVAPVGDFAVLDSTVDTRFDDTRNRPVLAQTFEQLATGALVTVANNHLKSKGSGCGPGDDDARQGNCNGTRTAAAEAMADWLAGNPTGQLATGTLIIGDLNAYAQEDPIEALRGAGYHDLLDEFAPEGTIAYTFTFDATQGYLDHALADGALRPYVTGAAAWNINADEVPAIDYLESEGGVPFNQRFRTADVAERFYDPSKFRSSDHDPVLVGLDLAPLTTGDCKNFGWQRYPQFRNQGLCVASVATRVVPDR